MVTLYITKINRSQSVPPAANNGGLQRGSAPNKSISNSAQKSNPEQCESLIDSLIKENERRLSLKNDRKTEFSEQQSLLQAEETAADQAEVHAEELERVREENRRLSVMIGSLKEQFKLTKGYRPNEKALNRVRGNC